MAHFIWKFQMSGSVTVPSDVRRIAAAVVSRTGPPPFTCKTNMAQSVE